jgi:hypothetical protein
MTLISILRFLNKRYEPCNPTFIIRSWLKMSKYQLLQAVDLVEKAAELRDRFEPLIGITDISCVQGALLLYSFQGYVFL